MACNAEDCGFQMLNDDEIVTSVQEFDLIDDEMVEDEDNNNESSKGSANANVFSVLETSMEWYEQQSECCPTQLLLLLKRIRDFAAKKRRCRIVQRPLFSTIKIPVHFIRVVGNLGVRAPDSGPEGLSSMPVPPNTLRVHPEYVLVKSVGPKVLWAESRVQGAGENFPPLQFHS
ncbi:uncharacterized protein TNCV_436381 [Trichonephila clavipes]|nr:uncharacterized protein TNCV_436381 [Trichonephila clavipes]